ncbi:MAG: NADH-quinone oxidoreductase subunit L [Hyphomonadaceae bacterium]
MIEPIIVLGPLAAAAVAGLLQKRIGDVAAMALTTGAVCLAALLSIYVFVDYAFMGGAARTITLFPFIDVAGFTSTWSIRIDTLSAVMLVVVTGVSSLVHIYSIGYMAEDPHRARFFSYLSFFTFAMLALVTANDFLQMFFGWEGVGVASYLLIGFWYDRRSANDAAIKAFVVNRVGDFGFALGIMACFWAYGSIEFDKVFAAAAANPGMTFALGGYQLPMIEVICVLLFIGAMGKSAQFFLHTWLPDAMEGPTPVSALIHAATMVTAGVFMVSRCSALYEMAPYASGIVTILGAATAFFAATVGVAQNDIKRVIAYSTCSQLGYMFFAAGVGAYNVAMFHLFTHAFFKALLFLGAGSVIHGMHHEQDMRAMGGLRKYMPVTFAMMLIGTLALIGFGIPGTPFGLAGFFSKDAAIESAFAAGEAGRIGGQLAFWAGISAAFLTSFYSWRLAFMTFEGALRGPAALAGERGGHAGHDDPGHDDHGHDDHAHHEHGHTPHESPWIMLGPLVVLAIGAVFAGVVFAPFFIGGHAEDFWRHAVVLPHGEGHGEGGEAHHPPAWVVWAPLIVTAAGFLLAVLVYLLNQGLGARIAKAAGPLHAFLYNKWYFDELYDLVFVKGARALGDLFWKVGDQKVIDGLGPNGIAWLARFSGRQVRKVQTGYLYHYSFLMLFAVVAIGAFALWRVGAFYNLALPGLGGG